LVSAKAEFDAGDVKQLIYALYDVVLDTPHDLEVQVRGGGGTVFRCMGVGAKRIQRDYTQQCGRSSFHRHAHTTTRQQ
jgi:hypothetical protein